MSLKTWKREFAAPDADLSIPEALDAMILQWTGLLPRNLREHEITAAQARKLIPRYLCNACHNDCRNCPVAQVRAEPRSCRCYALRTGETESPFTAFYTRLDAEPMLTWLRRAKKMLNKEDRG